MTNENKLPDTQSDETATHSEPTRSSNCIACLEPIFRGSKVCPNCGRDQSLTIQKINRFGGVVATVSLLVTIIGATSAYLSSTEATNERIAAEDALKKAEAVEGRIEDVVESLSEQAADIEAQASSFYVSQVNSFKDVFQAAYGSCQVGPNIECFSRYREALNIAYEIMKDSNNAIFIKIDEANSITDTVCFYVDSMKSRAAHTIDRGVDDLTMAEETFQRSTVILDNNCQI